MTKYIILSLNKCTTLLCWGYKIVKGNEKKKIPKRCGLSVSIVENQPHFRSHSNIMSDNTISSCCTMEIIIYFMKLVNIIFNCMSESSLKLQSFSNYIAVYKYDHMDIIVSSIKSTAKHYNLLEIAPFVRF